ncbi:multicopper oxidase domain-containing protein [Synechococcus sp. CCY 9618]|uniref:multicopper oxidase domain-containing protein n=1 Tax=Synechococcus sp. CCY 9618 TaxID=2815602 RepID=UPI0020B2858B|nr:multicopper oxidase domain-containing protein [Synechococcus sp. CCY 9618]
MVRSKAGPVDANRHGTVADQVFGGLGGVILVRGPLDGIPELRQAREEVLFLKDFPTTAEERWPSPMARRLGRESSLLTVNGALRPDLPMGPGGGMGGMGMGMGMAFLINGRAFDPARVDTTVRLGSTEDWVGRNSGVMDHPFHVHVNPFQMLSRNGRAEPFRAWKDTGVVRPGEEVRIRTAFRDFPGRSV